MRNPLEPDTDAAANLGIAASMFAFQFLAEGCHSNVDDRNRPIPAGIGGGLRAVKNAGAQWA